MPTLLVMSSLIYQTAAFIAAMQPAKPSNSGKLPENLGAVQCIVGALLAVLLQQPPNFYGIPHQSSGSRCFLLTPSTGSFHTGTL